ncbi:MAG: hypothetical protein VW338_08850 [Rhodospirillaceae bacterium]
MNYDGSRDGDQNGRPEAAGSDGPGATTPIVLTAELGKDLLIPDGAWTLGGQYVRQGADLLIKGADGQLVVVRGFFNLASPPDLHTDSGAVINAQLATRLAGPLAQGEVAQAGPQQAGPSEPIGKVTTATCVVEGTRANGTKVVLKTGDAVHWLRIEGIVEELYDVVFLPGVRRPMAYGFKSDEIRRTLNVGGFGTL